MMRRIIENAGHDVVEADDGAGGIEKYFLEKPDAAFLDLTMKDMYGLDVLAKIRELDPDTAFVEKPFSAQGLREAARLLLFGALNPSAT